MMPVQSRARSNLVVKIISFCVAAMVSVGALTPSRSATAGEVPTFAVEAAWPKPLPNNWILGQVGGITVDWQGHIWVIHRPRSLTDDEQGAGLNPPFPSGRLRSRTV